MLLHYSYTEGPLLQIVTEIHLHEKLICVLQAGANYLSSQIEESKKPPNRHDGKGLQNRVPIHWQVNWDLMHVNH